MSSSKPRITISVNADGDFLEIFLNLAGRDLLVQKLQNLSERSDHRHLGTSEFFNDIELSSMPYRSTDRVITMAKIALRPDEWDREHFPHVLTQS